MTLAYADRNRHEFRPAAHIYYLMKNRGNVAGTVAIPAACFALAPGRGASTRACSVHTRVNEDAVFSPGSEEGVCRVETPLDSWLV